MMFKNIPQKYKTIEKDKPASTGHLLNGLVGDLFQFAVKQYKIPIHLNGLL